MYVWLGIGLIVFICVAWDASNRVWYGRLKTPEWSILALLCGLLVLPFYAVARTRSTKKPIAA